MDKRLIGPCFGGLACALGLAKGGWWSVVAVLGVFAAVMAVLLIVGMDRHWGWVQRFPGVRP